MTARARLSRAGPTAVAALALAVCSGYPLAPGGLALSCALSALVPLRAPLDRATMRLAAVVVTVLVIAAVRAADLPVIGPVMSPFAFGVGLASLSVSVTRLFVQAPEGGRRVDVALSLMAILACGAARPGPLYAGIVAAFVAVVALSARADDAGRAPLARLPARAWTLAGLVVVVALVAAAATGATLVPVSRYVSQRFQMALVDRWESRTGFSDTVRFGRVTKLLRNDTVVLRLRGPHVTHLRGVVLDTYGDERWTRSSPETLAQVGVPSQKLVGDDVVELRAVHVDGERLFLPLGMRGLASASGGVRVDAFGTLRHLPSERSAVVWFRPGDRDAARVAGPRPDADLQVAEALRGPLSALATSWVKGIERPEDALRVIQERLQTDFTYSRDYARTTRLDAVAEFLFVSRVGHCEAFASAMVLLARSVGIPARLVAGYRVGAKNPIFSHWVVRQNNAHAWVEAYLPEGRWATFDPTPMAGLPQDVPHDERGAAVLIEALAVGFSRAEDWLAERTVFELGGAALVGLFAFAALRLRRARANADASVPPALSFSRALPAFERLARALDAKGLGRKPGETLATWATRLPPAAAEAVSAYARLRYGGAKEDVVPALEAALRTLDGGRLGRRAWSASRRSDAQNCSATPAAPTLPPAGGGGGLAPAGGGAPLPAGGAPPFATAPPLAAGAGGAGVTAGVDAAGATTGATTGAAVVVTGGALVAGDVTGAATEAAGAGAGAGGAADLPVTFTATRAPDASAQMPRMPSATHFAAPPLRGTPATSPT